MRRLGLLGLDLRSKEKGMPSYVAKARRIKTQVGLHRKVEKKTIMGCDRKLQIYRWLGGSVQCKQIVQRQCQGLIMRKEWKTWGLNQNYMVTISWRCDNYFVGKNLLYFQYDDVCMKLTQFRGCNWLSARRREWQGKGKIVVCNKQEN